MTQLTRRLVLGTGAAALAATGTAAQAQTATRLKIQTAVPTASIYFDLMKRFGDRVDKMSGGRLKFEMLPDGAVVAAFEIVDAVDKGVVDGGGGWREAALLPASFLHADAASTARDLGTALAGGPSRDRGEARVLGLQVSLCPQLRVA